MAHKCCLYFLVCWVCYLFHILGEILKFVSWNIYNLQFAIYSSKRKLQQNLQNSQLKTINIYEIKTLSQWYS